MKRLIVISGPANTRKMPLTWKLMGDTPELALVHRVDIRRNLCASINGGVITEILGEMTRPLLGIGYPVIVAPGTSRKPTTTSGSISRADSDSSIVWLDVRAREVTAMIPPLNSKKDTAMDVVYDSAEVTWAHIERVRDLLNGFAAELSRRGHLHDASKFDPVEKGPLDEMQRADTEEGQAPFGSDEYKRRTALLGPMLQHHYAHNSHHPEHYGDAGVNGMDLADLVEMFFDWKAASERGEESSMNLTKACERFGIEPQLAAILRNTADRLGFKAD